MTRSPRAPTVLTVISLILLFEPNHIVKSQPFFEEEIVSMSIKGNRAPMRNRIENCFKPEDVCELGSRSCCSGSTCKCNLWGYNCRCQINDDMPMSIESDKTFLLNPSEKWFQKINFEKRSCIRRGGACDHRPKDCCFSSSCRCNLWGSNCRCQRVGLFQKWG